MAVINLAAMAAALAVSFTTTDMIIRIVGYGAAALFVGFFIRDLLKKAP